ncbi:MAG: CPBP family intramembrane metalloprotease [Proteobacteria bacterium]|nr:CPBP family intramembrane metalloprotease [Pseudomonadota bacterium]
MRGWLAHSGTGFWRGPGGVRAGWRALAYALLLTALVFAEILLLAWAKPPWLRQEPKMTPGFAAVNEALLFIPVLAAAGFMAWLEGRSVFAFGLAARRFAPKLAGGLLAGVTALSLLMALLVAGGWAAPRWAGLPPPAAAESGLAWLGVCLLIGLTEETAFRGYLQHSLARGVGFWRAAVVSSLVFGFLHITNAHESVIGIANVCGAGLLLCLGLKRTGSLWWPIGFHAGWDFSENFIYGTHDSGQACAGALLDTLPHGAAWLSGGMAGPEGSVFGLATELLVLGGMLLFLRSGKTVFDMDHCAP